MISDCDLLQHSELFRHRFYVDLSMGWYEMNHSVDRPSELDREYLA
jgi:hypothetical protein